MQLRLDTLMIHACLSTEYYRNSPNFTTNIQIIECYIEFDFIKQMTLNNNNLLSNNNN